MNYFYLFPIFYMELTSGGYYIFFGGTMKKFTTPFLIVSIVFILAACGGGLDNVITPPTLAKVSPMGSNFIISWEWNGTSTLTGYDLFIKTDGSPDSIKLPYSYDGKKELLITWEDFQKLSVFGGGPYQVGVSAVSSSKYSEITWSTKFNNITRDLTYATPESTTIIYDSVLKIYMIKSNLYLAELEHPIGFEVYILSEEDTDLNESVFYSDDVVLGTYIVSLEKGLEYAYGVYFFTFSITWEDFKHLPVFGTGRYRFGISAVSPDGILSGIRWSGYFVNFE